MAVSRVIATATFHNLLGIDFYSSLGSRARERAALTGVDAAQLTVQRTLDMAIREKWF